MDATVSRLVSRRADPAVRARALVALEGRAQDDAEVEAARSESLSRGAVASTLAGLPASPPADADAFYQPKYAAPFHLLVALADAGAPPDPRVEATLDAAIALFARPDGGFARRGDAGHLCSTGNLARAAIAFGRGGDARVRRAVDWLVAQQRSDGGWHCFPEDEPGGIVDAWEPLAAFAALPEAQRPPEVRRGVAFFLDQRLGVGSGYEPWRRIHFPRHYYYDFLLGLELVTSLGSERDLRDPRLRPALDLLRAKRRPDGFWALDATHPDVDPEGDPPYKPTYAEFVRTVRRIEFEAPGGPSEWATLCALRVLARVDAASR